MPYKTMWYREGKVVFTEVIGEFSVEEMRTCNQDYSDKYFKEAEGTVHLVTDLRGMSGFPKNLAQIRDISRQTASEPKLGWFILVGAKNPVLKFLSSTVFQILGVKCKIVETLEDADQILERLEFPNPAK